MDTRSATRFGALRAAVWSGILAALAVLGLLLAFYQVVRGAVDQAALRRQAVALHANAAWRCQMAPGFHASHRCLGQLEAVRPGHRDPPGHDTVLAGR